jgi:hypothetical protein
MTRQTPLEGDERAVAIAGAAYRLAYSVLIMALLIDVVVRGYVLKEDAWDLLALLIASGGVVSLFKWIKHVPSPLPRWLIVAFWVVVVVFLVIDAVFGLYPFKR